MKWIVQLVSWPSTIVTTHYLPPSEYAYVALVSPITRFVALFTEAGIGAAIVNGLAGNRRQLEALNSFSLIAGALGTVFVLALSSVVARFYGDPALQTVIAALAIALTVESLAVVPASDLRRKLDFRAVALLEATRNITDVAVTLALAIAGFGKWAIVAGYLSGVVAWTVAVRIKNPVSFSRTIGRELSEVRRFSARVIARNIGSSLAYGFDTAIGGMHLAKSALGVYSIAFLVSYAPAEKITQLILRVVPSVLGNAKDDVAELGRYYLNVTGTIAVVAFPMFAGIALTSHEIAAVFFSKEWSELPSAIGPLCLFGIVAEIGSVAPHVLLARQQFRWLNTVSVLLAVIVPSAFFVLSGRFGVLGLALGWLVGGSISTGLYTHAALAELKLRWLDLAVAIRSSVASTVVMTTALLLLGQIESVGRMGSVSALVTKVAFGAIVYIICLVTLDRAKLFAMTLRVREWLAGAGGTQS